VLGGGVGERLRELARTRSVPRGRRAWIIAGVVSALVVGVIGWAVWPDGPEVRARQYTEATACLLTGAGGVADPDAAPVWDGMQQASLATRGKVQYLEVDGEQTSHQASTFLATLAAGRCDLVLTVGAAQNAALTDAAPTYPNNRFVLVGSGKAQTNVSVVEAGAPDVVRDAVRARVTAVLKDTARD
jgi:basic membrane lipoprotein Med (substrate-binding protein (PBP1-ABC) superfamily)